MVAEKNLDEPRVNERIIEMELERLREFSNHPFKVNDDSQMAELQDSISRNGILNPLIIRPMSDGAYEIISGHRRKYAAEKLGYRKVPVIIRYLRDDEAVISMVDSNLQRECISPSEKAFAYKMKYDVMKRKTGRKNRGQIDHYSGRKSLDIISEECGESPKQIQRYIKIADLIPELLEKVDDGSMGFTPAVQISYLNKKEQKDVLEAMKYLKDGKEYDDLYAAALCRERADWMEGMNATRLFSTLYGQTLNVGRVMTPTLAMIVEREAGIEEFKPVPFYRLSIMCAGIMATSDRFEKKEEAEMILERLKKEKSVLVTKIETVHKQEKPPQLYSLTSLQRDANRFLGFTAQQTLDYTQSLYEKKLVTYPRTDSRYLTDDMEAMIPNMVEKLAGKFGYTKNISILTKQVINNKKVSDHHAIIPTANVADAEFGQLPSREQKILSIITARLLSALENVAVRSETEVEFTCADTVFRAKVNNLKDKGWREVQDWIMGSKIDSLESENEVHTKNEACDLLSYIANLCQGKSYPLQNPKIEEGHTLPKKHFTDDIYCNRGVWNTSKKGAG